MKLIVVLLVSLTVLSTGQSLPSSLSDASSVQSDAHSIIDPTLARVRLRGNKLIVIGSNFSDGAAIVINGQEVVTRNDSESPTTRLIFKKGGKRIPVDTIANIHVENPNTGFSNHLSYFRSPSLFLLILPSWSNDGVRLQVGEYVLVPGLVSATSWFADPNTLVRVFDVPVPSDLFWSFQAVQPGVFRFYAEEHNGGEVPPMVLFDLTIFVE